MKELKFNIEIEKPFGNLYRKKTVLVAGTDNDCKVVVANKPHYPKGIARLPGGGVEDGETCIQAIARETKEELGQAYGLHCFVPMIHVSVEASDSKKGRYSHSILIYHLYTGSDVLSAGDDATSLMAISFGALEQLANKYLELSHSLRCTYRGENFLWKDYGKLYGPIHKTVATELFNSQSL